MGSYISYGDMKVEAQRVSLDQFIQKIKRLFSEKTKMYGLKPAGLFIVFPVYPHISMKFSSYYRVFINTFYGNLLNIAKESSKPLISIDLEAMLHTVISPMIYSALDYEKAVILPLSESIGHEHLSKLMIRLHERFTMTGELIDVFDSAIVYIPHLGLWASNDDLSGMLRSLIKSYVKKALVILVSPSKDEIEKLNLSYEKLGGIPSVFEINLLGD